VLNERTNPYLVGIFVTKRTVAENSQRFESERDRDDTEPLVSIAIFCFTVEAADHLAGDGNGNRWQSVSSHTLRRSRATYHLVERSVNVRTWCRLVADQTTQLSGRILAKQLKQKSVEV